MFYVIICTCCHAQSYKGKMEHETVALLGLFHMMTTYFLHGLIFGARQKFSVGLKTRPDTRLAQSRVGEQGPYLMSLHHLGRSSEAKDRKNPKKVVLRTDGRTDRRTD